MKIGKYVHFKLFEDIHVGLKKSKLQQISAEVRASFGLFRIP